MFEGHIADHVRQLLQRRQFLLVKSRHFRAGNCSPGDVRGPVLQNCPIEPPRPERLAGVVGNRRGSQFQFAIGLEIEKNLRPFVGSSHDERALLAKHHSWVTGQCREERIKIFQPPDCRHLTGVEALDGAEQFLIRLADNVRLGRLRWNRVEWTKRAAIEAGFENDLERATAPRLAEIHWQQHRQLQRWTAGHAGKGGRCRFDRLGREGWALNNFNILVKPGVHERHDVGADDPFHARLATTALVLRVERTVAQLEPRGDSSAAGGAHLAREYRRVVLKIGHATGLGELPALLVDAPIAEFLQQFFGDNRW